MLPLKTFIKCSRKYLIVYKIKIVVKLMQTHSFVDCYLFIKPKDNKWILKQENLLVTLKENAVLKGPFFCPTVINTEAILQTNVTCCL